MLFLQAGGSGWFKAIAEPSMAMAAHAGVRAFSIIVDESRSIDASGFVDQLLNAMAPDPARQGILALEASSWPAPSTGQHLCMRRPI